jgi:hypothetical protein
VSCNRRVLLSKIAITVLAAIMFAQGLQARSFIAVAKGLME